MPDEQPPLVLVGAGIASAIIAQRLSCRENPGRILILESSDTPFGEHTWSFHDADVEAADLTWLQPLVAHHWNGQSVQFRNHRRHLTSGYSSLTSASVIAAMERLANVELRKNTPAVALHPDQVTLSNGTSQYASCVIDCRGYRLSRAMVLGYQKFLGLEVELRQPHALIDPVIMDASVDQRDGYRFLYVLPLSPTRLLIEDTRYSDDRNLDETALAEDVRDYASAQHWTIDRIIRRERGVLPITLAHDFERFWSELPTDVPQAGLRAGLFHPTTGYSLPEAVRLANLIAARWPSNSATLAGIIRQYASAHYRRHGFYRLLNRMLFRAARPDRRHLVLERFYKLPQPLIERFYAGRTSRGDIARILIGKPPVPIHRALACLREAPLLKNGSP
ncbi:lycopene beta-cyclase CrtY [Rhizobium deserti]|uniref:Lycopene beta-cyclase CrtY n=1 Tax=Rhizobium deserti TaxID=2547961 RepID=A0A4R5UGH6_9HYPH|nr:lycopene beta-cyclase CrtY [Rhizobium deserti]TDK35020.1 lycopene beta-cyclase CrtY [Rhizobium deserti]